MGEKHAPWVSQWEHPHEISQEEPICSMHATGSLLICLFAPCMLQALSSYAPICSMHATATLSLFAYLLHACCRLLEEMEPGDQVEFQSAYLR